MNWKRALSTSLSNKIQGYLTKCYWKARKQGNFMNSEGVHEYDSHIYPVLEWRLCNWKPCGIFDKFLTEKLLS